MSRWTLTLKNLGPHESTEVALSATGRTDVSGPSECGKSYLVEGFAAALSGRGADGQPLPPGVIRDGADRCEVSVQTPKGGIIRRTATAKGSKTRTLTRPGGEPEPFTTDEAFRSALGPLGNPDLVYALAPFAWRRLLADNARPLRDLLLRYLPPADLRAEVARLMAPAVLRRDDPLDGKGAENARRDANRRRDEAAGRLASARERVAEAAPAPTVTPEALSAARETVAAGERWERHTAARKRWLDSVEARAQAVTALEAWQARRDAIPAAPTDDLDGMRTVGRAAESRVTAAADALANIRATLSGLRERLDDIDQNGGACPTCGALWDQAATVADLRESLARSEEAERHAVVTRDHAQEDAREANAAYTAAKESAAEHAAALRALGPEPTVPPEAPEPTAPAGAQPTAEALAAAEQTIATAAREAGAAEAAAIAARNATAAVGRETAAHAAAVAEAARLDALVQAVRKAPSELARRQSEALGDLGPVSLLWGDGTAASPAVSVLCDKRPMERPYCATGRQIIGDLWLRRALRRVMGAPWLPLFVDEAQSAAGQTWPEVEGPVVYLWTTADGELRSVVTEAAEAA
jgi:hypothetical protein